MFDFESLKLHDSIAKSNQKKLQEAADLEKQNKINNQNILIESLVSQRSAIDNSFINNVLEKKKLVETVGMTNIRDQVYSIFESALVAYSDDQKVENRESLKGIFDNLWDSHLQQNGVTDFNSFKNVLKESHSMLPHLLETSLKFASNNVEIFSHLLENYYTDSNIGRTLTESYNSLIAMNESTHDLTFLTQTLDILQSKINSGAIQTEIVSLIVGLQDTATLLSRYTKSGVDISKLVSRYSVILRSYISALNIKIHRESDSKTLENIQLSVEALFDELDFLVKSLPVSDKKRKILEKDLEIVSQTLSELNNRTALRENASEFYTNLGHQLSEATVDEENRKVSSLFAKIKDRIKNTLDTFDPYKGLEELIFVNKLMLEHNQNQVFMTFGVSGSTWTYLIIKAIKSGSLTDKMLESYKNEAIKFTNNLEKLASNMENTGRQSDAKKVRRQAVILRNFLTNESNLTSKKLVRESTTNLDMRVTNAAELAQYMLVHEMTLEDLKIISNNLLESFDNDDTDDKKLALKTIQCEVCGSSLTSDMNKEYLKLESALYESINSVKPEGLTEAHHISLKGHTYPVPEVFLDDDEKAFLNQIANFNGKNQSIDVIRNKVITVIENEKQRAQEREEEEAKALSKLSSDRVSKLQESFNGGRLALGGTDTNTPDTLFSSIMMDRSRKFITESGTAGLKDNNNVVLETITLYTIHETFNTLNIGSHDYDAISKLKNTYFYNKK